LLNLAGLYGVDALSKDVVELVKVTESSLDAWTDWLSHDRDEKLVRPLHVAVAQMTKKVIRKATRWDDLSVHLLKAVQQVAKRARTQEERPNS
jgi:3-dehydroquinate dehydratase